MSSLPKTDLRLDWCSRDAALYAAKNWHYSRSLSAAKNAYLGVWERGKFIGAIVFGIGAGAVTNGSRFGLARTNDMAELTRVALTKHSTPVSRILSIACRMIKRQSPGLRLLVSMADPREGHYGGIYQAAGWIYSGEALTTPYYWYNGRWCHARTVTSSRGTIVGLPSRPSLPKYRYLFPLDEEMRRVILPLAKPYPKPRVGSDTVDTPADQAGKGGSTPTPTLHPPK